MIEVIFHLGSNVGKREVFLKEAVKAIDKQIGKVIAESSFYETEPWGEKDQDDFINFAILVQSSLSPIEILTKVKQIEKEIGRLKTTHWGPRVIDIDILFYGNQIIDQKELTIPHGELQNRNFVLIPLMEIAGEWMHPVLHKSIEDLYIESTDKCEVRLLET